MNCFHWIVDIHHLHLLSSSPIISWSPIRQTELTRTEQRSLVLARLTTFSLRLRSRSFPNSFLNSHLNICVFSVHLLVIADNLMINLQSLNANHQLSSLAWPSSWFNHNHGHANFRAWWQVLLSTGTTMAMLPTTFLSMLFFKCDHLFLFFKRGCSFPSMPFSNCDQ